jgi:hypothetical protein
LIVGRTVLPPLWADAPSLAADQLARVGALWSGFLSAHPSFASGFVVATLAAWVWGAVTFVRAWGTRGLFPTLLPIAILLSVAANGPAAPERWGYDAARLAEPALPWLALSLALGLSTAGEFIWRRSGPGMPLFARRWPLERVVACLPLLFWLLSGVLLWVRVPAEYAWGSRNVAELPQAAGRWLAANAPRSARIGLADGSEAVRSSSPRSTRQLLATGDARVVAQEQGMLYLVAYRGTPAASWPMAREVLRLGTPRNVALPSPELSVFRLDWSVARLEQREPAALNLTGYQVIDALDVGDDAS